MRIPLSVRSRAHVSDRIRCPLHPVRHHVPPVCGPNMYGAVYDRVWPHLLLSHLRSRRGTFANHAVACGPDVLGGCSQLREHIQLKRGRRCHWGMRIGTGFAHLPRPLDGDVG